MLLDSIYNCRESFSGEWEMEGWLFEAAKSFQYILIFILSALLLRRRKRIWETTKHYAV